MRYINHKSDFQVIINIKDKEGNIIPPPSVPWEAVFADENGVEFKCYFDGTNYTHCIVDFSDIVCFIDNPGFSCGKLRCTFHQYVPSAEYCDGVMDLSQPLQCDIMLSKRESDDSLPITIEAYPNWVRGPQGEQGIQGPQGIKGDKGDKGEKGEKGDTGEKGDRGEKGDKGNKGDTGEKGDRGEKGDQGERGMQGVQGVKGDDGVSPTVSTSKTGKVTTIEITDANGVHTATVNDGESVEVVQSTGTSTTSVMSQKAVSDALSNVYTKADSDAMLAEKQNVLTAGNGITIADDVISVAEEKFTVWSNPRIDEYVTTFENFGYNDDGTQKTSGSSTRSWVFRIVNYGHNRVYFSAMNAWMCDGLDDAQNMINPTLLGKSAGNVNIGAEQIGKYIVAMTVNGKANVLGSDYCRCVMFCGKKTQAELDADERMLSDMYAGNLMRYAVATSEISDTPTLEWGNEAYLYNVNVRNVFLDIVSRPNIAYECKVVKNLSYLYQGCGRLLEITPLWDTSLVTNMRNTFQMCRSLKYADLSHLDMGAVTDTRLLFRSCISIIDAKLPHLPSVTNCSSMFNNCPSLQSLYLDMPNCENFAYSFYGCNALHTVEIVDVRKATSLSNSFINCNSLQNVNCVEELPKCSISFSSSSKLTLESVTNIITHLPNLSGEDSKTLTLHKTTKALLTESLIAEATNKNWIIA